MLQNKASYAVSWSVLEQILQVFFNFAFSVVMARLVTPEDFGTVALLSLFMGVATVFMNGGLTVAVIQKKDTTREDESTVFWFNIFISLVMGAVIALAAPWIAEFYQKDILQHLTYALVFVFILSACNSLQHALFAKHLNMRVSFTINSASLIVSVIGGIIMACYGWGVWALVGQTVVMGLMQTALTWILSDWRPLFCFRKKSFQELFSFGGYIFLTNLISICHDRAYSVLIGRRIGVYDLGIYNRAFTTQIMATNALTQVVNRVAFPVFAQCQNEPEKLLRAFRTAQRCVMCLNLPAMLGIAVVAEPLIHVIYGAPWAQAAPILVILCVAASTYPMSVLNLSLLSSLGKGASFLLLELAKKAFAITLMVIASEYAIFHIACAALISSWLALAFNTYLTKRNTGFGLFAQFKELMPSLISSLGMVISVKLFQLQFPITVPWICLLYSVFVGGITYVCFSWFLQRHMVSEFIGLINKKYQFVMQKYTQKIKSK
jgi:O-antigen/teichoic acid export membrane protein